MVCSGKQMGVSWGELAATLNVGTGARPVACSSFLSSPEASASASALLIDIVVGVGVGVATRAPRQQLVLCCACHQTVLSCPVRRWVCCRAVWSGSHSRYMAGIRGEPCTTLHDRDRP